MKRGILTIIVLGAAGIILFISLAKSALDVTIFYEKEGGWGKEIIEYEIEIEEGKKEIKEYKLPWVRTLPGSWWYPLKRLRNYAWECLCQEGAEKIRMKQLMADKKVMEARIMFARKQGKMALDLIEEAAKDLVKIEEMIRGLDKIEARRGLRRELYLAGRAYEQVLKKVEGAVDIDEARYVEIRQEIQNWNEEQKEKIN